MEPAKRQRRIHIDMDISVWGLGFAIGHDHMDGWWFSAMIGPICLHARTRR